MPTLQNIIRAFRRAGARTNESCGIHIHLNGADHTVRSLKNFINIIASHNDLLYSALNIPTRRIDYCKALDARLVAKLKTEKPQTFAELEDIWYGARTSMAWRCEHYNHTRYHFINLHSFFHGHGTVELRCFNSTLHAGVVRSYIVLALALNHQALTARSASSKKVQSENQKFAMRTYMNRLGMIGDEFKNCRMHLMKYLKGSAAWRFSA